MNEIESDLVSAVQRALAREGILLDLHDEEAVLQVDAFTLRRPWALVRDRHRAKLQPLSADSAQGPVLLLGGRIPVTVADKARAHGDWYADAQGNAYVRAPGVHVNIRGRRAEISKDQSAKTSHPRETNLMSGRRAQVVFSLLNWPELVEAPVRYLAEAAGVSVSLAHGARTALEDERYITPGARSIERRDELLDRWAASFPLGMGRALELGRFVGEPDPLAWLDAGHDVYISGENARSELRGPDLTLYVPELDKRAVVRSRWRRGGSPDEVENIILRRAFWKSPWGQEDVKTHPHAGPRVKLAPSLLVYADLLASREPRQREVALGMRKELLAPPPR